MCDSPRKVESIFFKLPAFPRLKKSIGKSTKFTPFLNMATLTTELQALTLLLQQEKIFGTDVTQPLGTVEAIDRQIDKR